MSSPGPPPLLQRTHAWYVGRWLRRSKTLVLRGSRTLSFMSGCDPWNNSSTDSKRVHEGGLIFSTTGKKLQHFWRKNSSLSAQTCFSLLCDPDRAWDMALGEHHALPRDVATAPLYDSKGAAATLL